MSRIVCQPESALLQSQFRLLRQAVAAWNPGWRGGTVIPFFSLKVSRDGGRATITLGAPGSSGRVGPELAAELREACVDLAADDDLRVVILTGAGVTFATGREAAVGPEQIAGLQAAAAVAALPVPVVAALNGDAADHGLELALAADLRLAADGARFWFSPPSAGTFPFDGGTQRLPRLVGPAWAKDMLLTGRRVSAREALAIGLVNRVAAPDEDVLDLCRDLAEQIQESSPLGARYVKEAVMSGGDMSLPQSLGLEADLNVILQSTADRAEGIASFLERRSPEYTGE